MSMGAVFLSLSAEQLQRGRAVRAALESANFEVRARDLDSIQDAAFFIACTANDELQRALEQVRSGARDRSWLIVLPLDETEIPVLPGDATRVTDIAHLMRHLTRAGGVQGDVQTQNIYGPDVAIDGVKGDGDDMRGQNIRGSVVVGDVVGDRKVVITGTTVTSRKGRP